MTSRSRSERALRAVWLLWAAGFLVGTTTHVVDLVLAGPDVYVGFPAGVRAFWVALTVIDPLVVTLLLLRRRAGVVLGVVVMVADVAVNGSVLAATGTGLAGLVPQTLFGVFVVLTARPLAAWFRAPLTSGRRPPRGGTRS
ncbi:hypothetical protein M1843_16975 [Isoptericola sp. 4D.3]|uniref:Uncharacterized protein n=1 Tax=Isoptericola peretonis TaxID=2918523 RepID=A0ABT0J7H9_9MICO|nr:hypothetical protein [Isoptericola sp. 4D.3]